METPNIDFLMGMTNSYLDGKIDSFVYSLDFPYEVETRYKALLKEDRELAELIYDCLMEDGAYLYDDLTEEDFRGKISKEYEYIKGKKKLNRKRFRLVPGTFADSIKQD